MKAAYYKPSGMISPNFFLIFLGLMAVGIPVLSHIYIYLVYYIPYIQASFLLTIGCGAAVGFIMEKAVKVGKARNTAIVCILTFIAACVLKYIQWCVYIPLVFSETYGYTSTIMERLEDTVFLLTNPGEVYELALLINEYGVWGIANSSGGSSDNVTGTALLVVWIVEFIMIAVTAFLVARLQPKRPFSEEVGDWYVEMKEKAVADMPADFATLKHGLEEGRFAELVELAKRGGTDSSNFLNLTFYGPPADTSERCFVTIAKTTVKKGRTVDKTLVECIAIDDQSMEEILSTVS